MSKISFLVCQLLVDRKATDFHKLILFCICFAILLKVFFFLSFLEVFFVVFWRFLVYVVSSAHKDSLAYSLPIASL